MTCKFCGGHTVLHPEICQKCFPVLHAIEDVKPSTVEKIIRFLCVDAFMRTRGNRG